MSAPNAIPLADVHFPPAGSDEFINSIRATDLVYFLLNVGDGDAQLILLPEQEDGEGETSRELIVVDIASYSKMRQLVEALQEKTLLPQDDNLIFSVAVATHPHRDHIAGMEKFLRKYRVKELWEPGYILATRAFMGMSRAAEDESVTVVLPSSGYYRRFGRLVQLTVLAPAIGLRHRFDTYGVEINDSSLTLMVEYPRAQVVQEHHKRAELKNTRGQRLLLGADAQTASWAQVAIDFPTLHSQRAWLARQIRERQGADHLRADIFKVPHHASKRGMNLELVERVSPRYSLVSCDRDAPSYRFPHDLAQEILREARQPTAVSGAQRSADHELGIHYTSDVYTDASGTDQPLGSIALVMGPGRRERALWRLCDTVKDRVDVSKAVKI